MYKKKERIARHTLKHNGGGGGTCKKNTDRTLGVGNMVYAEGYHIMTFSTIIYELTDLSLLNNALPKVA